MTRIDVAGPAAPVAMVLTSFEPGGTERLTELTRRGVVAGRQPEAAS